MFLRAGVRTYTHTVQMLRGNEEGRERERERERGGYEIEKKATKENKIQV